MKVVDIPQVIFPVSEKENQDSYVYRSPILSHAVKMYWDCDKKCLSNYAGLQNELAEHDVEVDLGKEFSYRGKSFSQVVVNILKLPGESYPACFIGVGENYKKEVRITTPKYIEGENLKHIYDSGDQDILGEECMEAIDMILGKFMLTISDQECIDFAESIYENAIVCGIDGNSALKIVITDVSGNIRRFVRSNSLSM